VVTGTTVAGTLNSVWCVSTTWCKAVGGVFESYG
jgi:hypothetical protein